MPVKNDRGTSAGKIWLLYPCLLTVSPLTHLPSLTVRGRFASCLRGFFTYRLGVGLRVVHAILLLRLIVEKWYWPIGSHFYSKGAHQGGPDFVHCYGIHY